MPAWLISDLLKLAPFTTGVAAIEEPAPTWHTSQDEVVGMCRPGKPTMLKLAAGIAKLAADAPWHWAQLVLVLWAFAWMLVRVGITA
jgi:hypothetical protein